MATFTMTNSKNTVIYKDHAYANYTVDGHDIDVYKNEGIKIDGQVYSTDMNLTKFAYDFAGKNDKFSVLSEKYLNFLNKIGYIHICSAEEVREHKSQIRAQKEEIMRIFNF